MKDKRIKEKTYNRFKFFFKKSKIKRKQKSREKEIKGKLHRTAKAQHIDRDI